MGGYSPVVAINPFDATKVTIAAKKSGDYSVLSAADLNILAITSALHDEAVAKVGRSEDGRQEATEVCPPARAVTGYSKVTMH